MPIYVCIYMRECLCEFCQLRDTHTNTHTHSTLPINTRPYVCICISVNVSVSVHTYIRIQKLKKLFERKCLASPSVCAVQEVGAGVRGAVPRRGVGQQIDENSVRGGEGRGGDGRGEERGSQVATPLEKSTVAPT